MSERDPVALLLKTLDQPVAPRREFSDALRQRLLSELAEANGHRSWVPRPPLSPRPRRRRMLAAAVAIVLMASAVVAVLVTRPAPASALGLIRHAQRQVASLPPFEATIRFDINPDGKSPGGLNPKDATETMQVSYGGPKRLRTVITGEHTTIPGARPIGSYDVVNGNHYSSYDSQRKIFHTGTLSPYTRPLGDLAWKGGYPDWEKVCRGSAGLVLPDARVAGRDARHIRCTNPGAQVWQLWIDRQTGLLLKLKGQTGGEDDFFDAAPLTSQRGGFTITRLRYHPSFPAGTFKIAAPTGSLDYEARLREAEAKVPPFRALLSGRSHNGRLQLLEQFWWQDNRTWRINSLAGQAIHGGPGSFEVSAHGSVRSYNARDHSYSTSNATPNYPIAELLPEDDPRYPGDCPIVGHDQIEGRPAIHRRCPDREIWIDAATGLTLQTSGPGYQVRLRNLHYHPAFPPGAFHFTRPAHSRGAQQLADDPYYKTRLKPRQPAPNWRARLVNGGSFQITDLRGKPALLLLLADWCLSDPACSVFTPLERIYKQAKPKLAIIWVDVQGNPAQVRKIIRHNHLTFPVVNDPGRHPHSVEAWKFQAVPYWVLLDSHGHVIEARLKPQTLAQLRQLVNEAK